MGDRFAMIPLEAACDSRLSKNDFRVLIAISCAAGKSKTCHPKRQTLADQTGLPVCKISTITARLVSFGWLEKSGNGGRNSPAIYTIKTPETRTETVIVYEDKTRTETETVTEPVTVTETVTKTRTETVRGKEKKKEKTVNSNSAKTQKNGISLKELPAGISEDAAREFIQHRRNKKAPLTQNAFDRAMRQAIKASNLIGISPDRAIQETIDAGWQGIKADWLQNRLKGNTNGKNQPASNAANDNIANLTNPDFWKAGAEHGTGAMDFCQTQRELRTGLAIQAAGFTECEADSGRMGRQNKRTH